MTRTTDRYLDEAAERWIRAAERGELAEKLARGGPPAYTTAGWNSGPAFTDWNRTRRAPSPYDLVEAWRQLTFGCSVLNANAVSRQTLRLYVSTSLGQHRPKRYLRGRPLGRAGELYLRAQPAYARFVKGADAIDEVTEHPLLRLIGEVNPDWDHSRLIRYTSLCLDIVGRAHWLPGDESGNPMRGRVVAPYLWPLLAQYVLPYRETEGSLVSHYRYFSREYEPGELVNFRLDSLRDPYALGQSPTQAAFAFVGLSDSYTALMENLLTQSVRPSVIVTNRDPEEPFGDAERRRLQREINYQLSAGGAGKAWVVDGSIDVKSLSVPPVSLAENEISETAIKYVSFIFGVPLSFLRNEDSNRAVAEAGHYQHAKFGIEPRCVNIASTLTQWTHAEGRRRGQDWSRLLWAFDNPVKDDEEREAQVFDLRLRSGASTINEYRAHLGCSPVPWGDEPWLPGSLVQPSQAEAERRRTESSQADSHGDRPDIDDRGEGEDSLEVQTPAGRTAKRAIPWVDETGETAERAGQRELGSPGDDSWKANDPSDGAALPSLLGRKAKRRRKPTGRGKKPSSSRAGRDKTPKPPAQSTSHGAGSGEVIEIPPAGGHGNRLHYVHGGKFAPADAGTSPAAPLANKPKKRRGKVRKAEHNHARRQEQRVAAILGGKWLPDHEPMDVLVRKLRLHGVEVKTLLKGRRHGVIMHADALMRKVVWCGNRKSGRVVHTIVIDHRGIYYGGKYKSRYSGHEIYYKRGAGSYNLSQMYKVRSEAELRRLIAMPDSKLPAAAKGSLPHGDELAKLAERAAKAREYNAGRADKYREPKKKKLTRSCLRDAMGLEICFTDGKGEEYFFSLASASGWSLLGEWVDTLPPQKFPALVELVEEGEYKGTDVLRAQLESALSEHTPKDRNVAKTARYLLELIGAGTPEDSATVVNEDYEEDDDEDDGEV